MRCKCCNKRDAPVFLSPDYYCDSCYSVIASAREFNFTDLYEIVLGEEDEYFLTQYKQKEKGSFL